MFCDAVILKKKQMHRMLSLFIIIFVRDKGNLLRNIITTESCFTAVFKIVCEICISTNIGDQFQKNNYTICRTRVGASVLCPIDILLLNGCRIERKAKCNGACSDSRNYC